MFSRWEDTIPATPLRWPRSVTSEVHLELSVKVLPELTARVTNVDRFAGWALPGLSRLCLCNYGIAPA